MTKGALAGMFIVLVAATGVAAQIQVSGDASIWEEVNAAYQRLGALKAYRMRVAGTGGRFTMPIILGKGQPFVFSTYGGGSAYSGVIEVVPPDRMRVLRQTQVGTIEQIFAGNDIWTRLTGPGLDGVWQCQRSPAPIGAVPAQPQPLFRGEVVVSRLGEVVVQGARTQGYVLTIAGAQAEPIKQRLYVLFEGDLPRRAEILDPSEQVSAVLDYYDYDAVIRIEMVRCAPP